VCSIRVCLGVEVPIYQTLIYKEIEVLIYQYMKHLSTNSQRIKYFYHYLYVKVPTGVVLEVMVIFNYI